MIQHFNSFGCTLCFLNTLSSSLFLLVQSQLDLHTHARIHKIQPEYLSQVIFVSRVELVRARTRKTTDRANHFYLLKTRHDSICSRMRMSLLVCVSPPLSTWTATSNLAATAISVNVSNDDDDDDDYDTDDSVCRRHRRAATSVLFQSYKLHRHQRASAACCSKKRHTTSSKRTTFRPDHTSTPNGSRRRRQRVCANSTLLRPASTRAPATNWTHTSTSTPIEQRQQQQQQQRRRRRSQRPRTDTQLRLPLNSTLVSASTQTKTKTQLHVRCRHFCSCCCECSCAPPPPPRRLLVQHTIEEFITSKQRRLRRHHHNRHRRRHHHHQQEKEEETEEQRSCLIRESCCSGSVAVLRRRDTLESSGTAKRQRTTTTTTTTSTKSKNDKSASHCRLIVGLGYLLGKARRQQQHAVNDDAGNVSTMATMNDTVESTGVSNHVTRTPHTTASDQVESSMMLDLWRRFAKPRSTTNRQRTHCRPQFF